MDAFVFMAVLAAAACHAGWNALLKLNVAPVVATVLVAVAAGLLVLPLLPITPLPAAAAWPYIVASALIHVAYFVALAEAYRWGDLSQVYPIARGTAPLLTAALASLWLNEALGSNGWAGVIVLAAGILLLTVKGARKLAPFDHRAVAFALATSLTITAYTLVDGIGARLAGSALAYTVWLFIGDGITMAIYGALRVGP
ncbi:MAG TPA: EamA family transporter, partial [Hyphomicrobiaceae bacterium]|nr:EamA family transporter [Hyphomicrobiaceae bacterium]